MRIKHLVEFAVGCELSLLENRKLFGELSTKARTELL